jgi:hypothetical protein
MGDPAPVLINLCHYHVADNAVALISAKAFSPGNITVEDFLMDTVL